MKKKIFILSDVMGKCGKKMQMMSSQGHLSCSQLLLHTSAGLSAAKQVT